jgi:hypothetical protein
MSNYIWNEKQIRSTAERLSSRKGWLGSEDLKSGNRKKAEDYRKLMKILVDEGLAFSNNEDSSSSKYKIRFDRAVEAVAESPGFFTTGLLSSPQMFRVLSADGLGAESDPIAAHLTKQVIELRWAAILSALSSLDKTGKLAIDPLIDRHINKDARDTLLGIAGDIAAMYKAFELGWGEIWFLYLGIPDYDSLFLLFLRWHFCVDFRFLTNQPSIKPRSHLARVQRISTVLPYFLDLLDKDQKEGFLETLERNDRFQQDETIKYFLGDCRKLSDEAHWLKDYNTERLIVFGILANSASPNTHKAAINWMKTMVGRIDVSKRMLRRELSRKHTNKID